ncbi:FeoB-associated Cys-rich membrane protein [Geosporobacter ferrireducens]|uniref:FeoB-associated Cys-rich membrane protein n=1 Tax=Geosporobacter ferrireducens TaxID=1424294 RepID=UPI0009F36E71|nr:FeoB-associated Cys-rich membrane protein [Geosporobacter ferrireducens]MTI53517.1 FeoB-associated Cys-rich membrane protein [Geosporobacter ferrireducens]
MADFIVGGLIAAIVAFSIYRYIKRQKSGGGCDSCGDSCSVSDQCESHQSHK